jgi:hypothetical protein
MAANRKSSVRKRRTETEDPSRPPIRLVVKRGAIRRFEKLKEKTADLDVQISWDRREGDRRTGTLAVSGDRRKKDRRQRPPFTWDLADFAVVVNPNREK